MSPNTDEYWVGALSMTAARAHAWILNGRPDMALLELDDVLERFHVSPVMDEVLAGELFPYWRPKEVLEDDDQDALRPLR